MVNLSGGHDPCTLGHTIRTTSSLSVPAAIVGLIPLLHLSVVDSCIGGHVEWGVGIAAPHGEHWKILYGRVPWKSGGKSGVRGAREESEERRGEEEGREEGREGGRERRREEGWEGGMTG